MNRLILACLFCAALSHAKAQSLKLDLFTKVPAAFKNCGALYTYDTTALSRKKYILVVDMQNKGLISVAGKVISLTLGETKLVNKTINVSTYKGSGYTVVLSSKTGKQTAKYDMESGTIEVTKGSEKQLVKMHGQSGCDESKQEGN